MNDLKDMSQKTTHFPSVSLIISNYNGKKLLRDCLRSLYAQDYPGFYEVIVVDAGSTDGSPSMVKKEFPKVKLMLENRVGIGKAVNIGFSIAQGELLAFDVNTDEVFEANWLRTLVDALMTSDNIGVVGGARLLFGTKNVIDEAGITFNYLGIPTSHIRENLSDVPKKFIKVDYVGLPLFRKDLLKIVGMCDEAYFLYAEDEDFCARVRKASLDVLLIPQAVSYHRRSETISKSQALSVYYERRNHIRFIIINFSQLRMFFALFWYTTLLTIIEAFTFIPIFKKVVSSKESRLSFLYARASKKNFRAVISAICWNFSNFRSSIAQKYRVSNIKNK